MARIMMTLKAGKRMALPSPNEIEKQRRQLRCLEAMGTSPDSSPMRELVQMATEAGTVGWQTRDTPSTSRRGMAGHMRHTTGGKAPCKELSKVGSHGHMDN